MDTIIDNARVTIQNIHIRIEFTLDDKLLAFGVGLGGFQLSTVDDQNRPLRVVIPRAQKFRKRASVEDLSVYFDTDDVEPISVDSRFDAEMRAKVFGNHEYVLSPFTSECLLIHTRNDPLALKNVFEVATQFLKLQLGYAQCRYILRVSALWSSLLKRRRFATCLCPKDFEAEGANWCYLQRCAMLKARPYAFHIDVALVVLRNRVNYYRLCQEMVSKKGPHPILSSRIKNVERAMGPTASLYLRRYAEARLEQ
jgi:hypothetical protein